MKNQTPGRGPSLMFGLCLMAALTAVPVSARAQDAGTTQVEIDDDVTDDDDGMDMGWLGLLGLAGLLGLKRRDNHTHTHTETTTRRP